MKKLIILVLILAAGGAGAGFYYMRQAPKEPEVRTAQITRGDIIESVQATGTLEAVTTVEVGTQVGGVIQELYADFNDIVKKGQVIARLDPTILDTQIEQQKANVTRSEADLERLKVTLADSKQKLERARALSAKNLLAKTELDTAEVNVQSAEAQIKSSEAGLVQAKSQLNTAVVNRDHTVITAPIDGIVIERAVEPGQTVNAGMSAPKLFVLAADLTKMQVNANIDEADVGKIRPGQVVGFRVDAFANQSFTGAVQQVRLKPTTVQNVVTYQAIIHVPNLDYKLKPGMTASPLNIEINHRTDVLRIPTAAIRYRPTNETFAALKQEVPADFGRGGGRNARGGGPGGGGPGGPGGFGAPGAGAAPSAAPAAAPAAKSAAPEKSAPTQQANAAPQGARQPEGSPAEARGGGDRMGGGNGGGNGRGQGGGGRGGFDPNMTPEERQKRMEERMAAMTPEERQAFQERMAARGQGRGGFGGGQGQGGGQGGRGGGFGPGGPGGGPGGGRGGVGQGGQNGQNGRQSAQNGGGQGMRPGAPAGRVASTPSITGGATTIDSLFGPLPVVETRGSAWLFQEKKLKMVRVRLGVSDSTWTEILEGEGLKEGTDVVTNVIIETAQTPGGNNSNNPLMGPQRGRPGGQGGFGGPGGGGGGRGGGRG